MFEIRAFLNEDNTQVSLQVVSLSKKTITLTRPELDGFVEVLYQLRERMKAPQEIPPCPSIDLT